MPTVYPFATSTIVAQAFAAVELAPPSSFSDDTPQAGDAQIYYPIALDLCLEWCDWSFASRMVNLAETVPPVGIIDDPDLPHVFALPGDCVMFREVKIPRAKYRLDEGLLRADHPAPLPVRYTRRITNEASLPASFRASVALQLAVLLAPRWLGVETKRQQLVNSLEAMKSQASRPDARTASPENYQHNSGPADWVAEAMR